MAEIKKDDPIEIDLRSWHHQCGDGCCDSFGCYVLLNGEKLEHPDHDPQNPHDTDNSYFGDYPDETVRAVLKALGFTNVTVTHSHED